MERNPGMRIMKRAFLKAGICLFAAGLFYSSAFAWRGDRYYFHGGRFYRPSRFWFDIAVVVPPFGSIVEALPFGYSVMMIGGVPYFYFQGTYFRPCPSGYIVVPVPAPTTAAAPAAPAVPQPQSQKITPGDSVVINVPDKNGSYTPVTLVKYGNGFIGPQGEYYAGHPTVAQLKVLYGK